MDASSCVNYKHNRVRPLKIYLILLKLFADDRPTAYEDSDYVVLSFAF
jgi:hypothetical protein